MNYTEQSPSWEANGHSQSRNYPPLVKPKGSLPPSQTPPPVSILSQMNPVQTLLLYIPTNNSNIIVPSTSSHPSCLFPSGYPPKIFHAFLISYACCMSSPSNPRLHHPNNSVRTTYEAPHYAVFSSLPPHPTLQVQIFSSAPCSQKPSIHVHPLEWGTMFHTHTKR
jgi:hypothetical protein